MLVPKQYSTLLTNLPTAAAVGTTGNVVIAVARKSCRSRWMRKSLARPALPTSNRGIPWVQCSSVPSDRRWPVYPSESNPANSQTGRTRPVCPSDQPVSPLHSGRRRSPADANDRPATSVTARIDLMDPMTPGPMEIDSATHLAADVALTPNGRSDWISLTATLR